MFMNSPFFRSLVSAAVLVTLAACGGGGGTSTTTPPINETPKSPAEPAKVQVTGVAATGAPVQNGNVTIQCASGASLSTTTDANGAFSATVDNQTFPCLVTVSGGNLPEGLSLYSLALSASNVNVTPLTGLVLASALNAAPSTLAASSLTDAAAAALETGLANVNASLAASGYKAISGNPLTDAFQPVAGDVHDDLISQLLRSLKDENQSYAQLLVDVAAAGSAKVSIPLTHVFTAAELTPTAMPQLNKASLSTTGDELTMSLLAGVNPIGAFVGGGIGNKAVLQLPGLAGTKLIDFKNMSMDVKGTTSFNGKNIYAYVNLMVDLTCDGEPLPANATLEQVRAKHRIVIFDPFVNFVQQAQSPITNNAFTTVRFSRETPGWRISAGSSVGAGVAINPDYIGNETLAGFDFEHYPTACVVDGISGDGGMFRADASDAHTDPACNVASGLPDSAPAACGKSHSGAVVVLGDSGTDFASDWKVKKIRFEGTNARNFAFQ